MSATTHPIQYLIDKANVEWKRTLAGQSRSLRAATTTYKQRYGRLPPRGFDEWYKFARAHDVQLIDEYDQIHDDIAHLWALPASMLRRIDEENALKTKGACWRWKIENGEIVDSRPVGMSASENEAATGTEAHFIKPFLRFMGNLNITFSVEDGPMHRPHWHLQSRLLEMAAAGQYIDADDDAFVYNKTQHMWPGHAKSCPPGSPTHEHELQRFRDGVYVLDKRFFVPQKGVFIEDHAKAMNVCTHPDLLTWHMTTFAFGPAAVDVYVSITRASDSTAAEIVFPYTSQFDYEVGDDPLWEEKLGKVAWRGSSTGHLINELDPSRLERSLRSQRIRLVNKVHESAGESTIIRQLANRSLVDVTIEKSALNEQLTDCALSRVIQCGQGCDKLKSLTFVDPIHQSNDELNEYRYVLDIDGNGFSGRYRRLMLSNSLVFKATLIREWHTRRFKPWVHYVPILNSYEDLYDILVFFEGLPGRPETGHSALAERIASAGRDWTLKTWRMADMQAYALRVLLELARLYADDREAASYRG